MDFNDREKNDLFDLDKDIDMKSEKINEKLQLRKQKNNNKIMEQRKKRVHLITQNNCKTNGLNNVNYDKNKNKKSLLNRNDILIDKPLIKNISNNNIKSILEYLNSDDIEKNKWAIYSLRIYFEKNDPDLNEYLILFENKINLYLESLLKKYENTIFIINEIFFIIANLFPSDEIINKYQENYFLYFLNESYISIYQKYLNLCNDELIISVFFLLENIISEKNNLIKIIFKETELIHSILKIADKEAILDINIAIHFIKFVRILIKGIKDEYIENKTLFYAIFEQVYIIYKAYDKISLAIIKEIILLINLSLDCKSKDETEYEQYFMIDYLFKERNEEEDKEKYNNIKFILYISSSLYLNQQFFWSNNELVITSLDLLQNLTYNCTNWQICELVKYKNYMFFEILDNYYKYINQNNSLDNINKSYIIINLINICNNIIDSDEELTLQLIISELFSNLVKYFSMNLTNKIIVSKYLNVFERLLGYNDKRIADNLFKRGIIYEGILCNLLYGSNNCNCSFNEKMIIQMCKIISNYLQTVVDMNNKFGREDYLLCYNFKEYINNSNNMPENIKECILNLDYMKMI